MPIRLTEEHVRTFAERLLRVCEAMCGDEKYSFVDGEFRLKTTGTYHVARFHLGKKVGKLTSPRIALYDAHISCDRNQQILYLRALSDVMTYAMAALSSSTYVEPATSANKSFLYPQLYEELETIT